MIVLRVREPERPRPFRCRSTRSRRSSPRSPASGLILGLEASNWLRLLIWLVIGLFVYFVYGYRNSVLRRKASGG